MTTALVTHVARETLIDPNAKARIAQNMREVLYAGDPQVRVLLAFREILHTVPTGIFLAIIGDLAELWFDPGVFIDFSVEANRRLFRNIHGKPASVGNDGSAPTGSVPLVYMTIGGFSTNENDFLANNAGTGSFTLGSSDGAGEGYGIAPTSPG